MRLPALLLLTLCSFAFARQPGWHDLALMPQPRAQMTFSLVGDQIYGVGGTDGSQLTRSVFEYSPDNDTWAVLPDYPGPPVRAAMSASVGGYLFVFGGYIADYEATNLVWQFDPATGVWVDRTALPTLPDPAVGPRTTSRLAHPRAHGAHRADRLASESQAARRR